MEHYTKRAVLSTVRATASLPRRGSGYYTAEI